MRIISGYLGGRTFESPHGHKTHPMSEKMRGAIFNMLGDIDGLTVLDPFAGSGAISFEAISRGAKSALAIDSDKSANITLLKNTNDLGLSDRVKVVRANAGGWSDNNPSAKFDLVICDPPYDDIKTELLEKLSGHVMPSGLLVLSLPPNVQLESLQGFDFVSSKTHGDGSITFLRAA